MFLSVVIPAFNEEKRLPGTLKKIKTYLEKQSYDWEVLVVNDGSKDRTGEVIGELIEHFNRSPSVAQRHRLSPTQRVRAAYALGLDSASRNLASRPARVALRAHGLASEPNGTFRLIDNKENHGKGAVVKQGMLEAKGDWRLYMDADNSTDLSEIEKLWKFANPKSENGYKKTENSMENGKLKTDFQFPNKFPISSNRFPSFEIIAGSRYLKKDSIKIKQPLIRRIVSRVGNILIRILLGIHSADTQCGFKLFSAKATKEIFPLQTMERWGAEMEVWTIAIKKGYKIKEVAVDWYDAKGSTVRKSAAFKTLKELMIIKWNLMRGKYS